MECENQLKGIRKIGNVGRRSRGRRWWVGGLVGVIEHGSFRLETVLFHHIQITSTWGLEMGGGTPLIPTPNIIYLYFIYILFIYLFYS